MTVYGPRIKVHPDRTGGTKKVANWLIVLHTTEGSEGDNSAEALASLLTQPGDRQGTNGMYGASYNYVTDNDRVLPAVPENIVSYSAPPANDFGIHIVLPGKASQTREQWLDTVSRKYIRQAASVMVDISKRTDIPLTRLTVQQMLAKKPGYCDHDDVSDAWHKTTHYDLGENFPWDVLAADIAALLDQEDPTVRYFRLKEQPTTLWGTTDGLLAVRLEAYQVAARGDVPPGDQVPLMSKAEADKMVFISGFTNESVK